MSKKKYKPRTEAQKAARRERDRKRREALKNGKCKTVVKPCKHKRSVSKNTPPKVRVGVIAVSNTAKKRLVKVTIVKEYIVG